MHPPQFDQDQAAAIGVGAHVSSRPGYARRFRPGSRRSRPKGPLQHQEFLAAAVSVRAEMAVGRIADQAADSGDLVAVRSSIRRSTPGSGEAIQGKESLATTALWLRSALIRIDHLPLGSPRKGCDIDQVAHAGSMTRPFSQRTRRARSWSVERDRPSRDPASRGDMPRPPTKPEVERGRELRRLGAEIDHIIRETEKTITQAAIDIGYA
jgi:hypothetical protein